MDAENLYESLYSEIDLYDKGSEISNDDSNISIRSISGAAYNGSISSTYLEYFNGIIDRLPWGTNYLIYRAGQYNYMLVYGDALSESDGRFSASEANYINIYNYNGTEITSGTDSVNVSVGNAMVYSNIEGYSNSLKGVTHAESVTFLFVIALILFFNVIKSLFGNR